MTSLLHTTSLLSRIALRLLLVLSLWDGPVVWGHSHATAMSRTESLAAHIAAHHACEGNAAHLGWHWHFSIPDADGADPSREKTSRRVAPSVLPAAESALVVTSQLADAPFGYAVCGPIIGCDDSHAPASFRQGRASLSRPSPRPDLSSRLRC